MIDKTEGKTEFMEDLGRPNIFTDEGHQLWFNIHKFIKESDIPIRINAAFAFVESILADPDGRYGGGGFTYQFWFNTEKDRTAFRKEIDRLDREYDKATENWKHK